MVKTRDCRASISCSCIVLYADRARTQSTETGIDSSMLFTSIGLICIVISCAASAAASVLNQYVLQQRHSLNVTNLYMYVWGTVVTTVLYFCATAGRSSGTFHPSNSNNNNNNNNNVGKESAHNIDGVGHPLSGLNWSAMAYVGNMVVVGLLVSVRTSRTQTACRLNRSSQA